MLSTAFLCGALALIVALYSQSGFRLGDLVGLVQSSSSSADSYKVTCQNIAKSISSASQVFYPPSQNFDWDISHWANSSSQVPVCTVEPGTPTDVGIILKQISQTRVPFAVKSGGHGIDLGFSSTKGVHISMARFREIVIHEDSGTVDIGAGLTWTEVYEYLVPRGLNVVGGRLDGVGVASVTLGGGYSWKTNQYGLVADTATAFELVLPCGDVKTVTEQDKDLWFALKGGLNNYGIMTKFTLKLHTQTEVWGAWLTFAGDLAEPAQATFASFLAQQHDHKAAQIGTFLYSGGSVTFVISLFYDGPEPPASLYDELLNLTSTAKSIFRGSFTDFISSQFVPTYKRVYFGAVPTLRYTESIMKAFSNETQFWGERLTKHDSSTLVVYSMDPFEPDFLTHGGPSAYPPDRSLPVLPSSIYLGWNDESVDHFMANAIRTSTATLVQAGIQCGQNLKHAAPYTNYAFLGTPVELMYGDNLERLRAIRRRYDPEDVMGLAGGWKF